jgi:hypothetical protein
LPWHLTEYEREQGNYFAPDWPGQGLLKFAPKLLNSELPEPLKEKSGSQVRMFN